MQTGGIAGALFCLWDAAVIYADTAPADSSLGLAIPSHY